MVLKAMIEFKLQSQKVALNSRRHVCIPSSCVKSSAGRAFEVLNDELDQALSDPTDETTGQLPPKKF
jgi:hypothetical protein